MLGERGERARSLCQRIGRAKATGKRQEERDAKVANGHRMWSNLRGTRTGRTAREEEHEAR